MKNKEEKIVDIRQYIVFKLNDEDYGLDIQKIQTIDKVNKITRVPKAPFYIQGVINLRGEIIPVMSLRKKLGFEDDEFDKDARIIIVKIESDSIAMIVDKVKEVVEIDVNTLEAVQEGNSKISVEFIKGLGKIDNKIITILNIKKLIKSIEDELSL